MTTDLTPEQHRAEALRWLAIAEHAYASLRDGGTLPVLGAASIAQVHATLATLRHKARPAPRQIPVSEANPSDASRIGSLAAQAKWAACDDRTAATDAARKAFEDRFVQMAREKFGDLPDAELAQHAKDLRKAHFASLALKSAETRRAKSARRTA